MPMTGMGRKPPLVAAGMGGKRTLPGGDAAYDFQLLDRNGIWIHGT